MHKRILYLSVAFLAVFSCNTPHDNRESSQNKNFTVAAVNYPLAYFAERIGGDKIDVLFPVPADVDPAYWMPDEETISLYQNADIILINGAGYAKWMESISLPSSRILNTSGAMRDRYVGISSATHSHGPDGEHEHTGFASTAWLNFEIAASQAETIKDKLADKVPEEKEVFDANFIKLQEELLSFDTDLKSWVDTKMYRVMMASHPVYQYLGAAYHLEIHSEHWEPGEPVSDEQWDRFINNLDAFPADIMLWEGAPDQKVHKDLENVGIQVVIFNPCGNRPETGDFISVMKENVRNLTGQ